MKVIKTTTNFAEAKKDCVLTIGNFDGLHVGHQEILTEGAKIAARKRTELVAITFHPHPAAVLHSGRPFDLLTPLELKKRLLAQSRVDCLFVLENSTELLGLSPTDFVGRFLSHGLHPSVVVEGENFHFGHGRVGNVHTLASLGQENGFEVTIIPAKEAKLTIGQRVKVSSTMIRSMIRDGKIDDATIALARPYRLLGQVVPGRGRGKELGFPTANLKPAGQIIPGDGVYAGRVEIADSLAQACDTQQKIPAVFSIGRAQTFGTEHPQLIEAHLLKENVPQLYGKYLAMDFVKKIRDQIKFESQPQLIQQITTDCQTTKQLLI